MSLTERQIAIITSADGVPTLVNIIYKGGEAVERKTVTHGDYIISVDTEKTKEYYEHFKKTDTQANRNYLEYCNTMSEKELAFFDSLGIDPKCCNTESIGVSKRGECPCGGYYLFCGDYIEYPPEELMTVDELVENNFVDNRNDPRINIGIFEFDFQVPSYEFCDIPDDIPDGFICVRFWCEDMKWLLDEKPEEIMYEPPKFWEIHKKIKEYFERKADHKRFIEEEKSEWTALFDNLQIRYGELPEKELRKHKAMWVDRFAPRGKERNKIKKLCVNSREYAPFLWHLFSFEYVDAETEANARSLYDKQSKDECIIVNNTSGFAYSVKNASRLDSLKLDELIDVTVTSADFKWTYSKTHEGYIGPFFYSK